MTSFVVTVLLEAQSGTKFNLLFYLNVIDYERIDVTVSLSLSCLTFQNF